ncbi:MAG: lipoprotein insertase outer membrane protein LolB [Acidiferrobacterales bacterium]|nr:lipoprotein insertase outer membrane protein LolB [Acidiferrobacterales bacterium]
MPNFRFFLVVALIALLSACQTLEPQPPGGEWLSDETIFAQRQADFEAQTVWQYSAKVGVLAEQLQEQANIVWDYGDQTNNVRLFGPFGAGQIKLQFDQYGVQLSDSKGVLHQGFAADGITAESLLTDITKLPIPVDALVYWLFVLPDPDYAFSYQLDPQGRVVALRQLGWQISFSDYREYVGNILPRRVTAIRDEQEQSVTVKLVTKAWQWPL